MSARVGMSVALVTTWLVSGSAWAQQASESNTAACSTDFVAFQEERQASRLVSARAAALRCARDECPDSIRKMCIAAVDEIGMSTPTVVVRAVGPDGCDTTAASVKIDGTVREGPLDGKPVDLDPGTHTFTVTIEGAAPITRTLLIGQGEKNRAVVADASNGASCGRSVETPAKASPTQPPPEPSRPITVPTIVFGSIGIAALGASGVLGVTSLVRRGDACDETGCDPAEVDGIRTTFIAGDILLATGVVSLGVATILHLTRPTERGEVGLTVDVGPRGPRAALGGTF